MIIGIMCITETLLYTKLLDDNIAIEGYQTFRKDRDTRGGGVLLYVRNNRVEVPRPDLSVNGVTESCWIEVKLPKVPPFLVCSLYRPPNANTE